MHMMRIALAAAVALVASPGATQTATTETASVERPSTDTSDARRIVCKKEEAVGSRLAVKKLCLTVQEWEDRAKHWRDETESWQRMAPASPAG